MLTRDGGQKVDEARALTKLAHWAYRFSPLVSRDSPLEEEQESDPRFYGINIDITGCERLFGSERNIVQQIQEALSRAKISSRIAIAPTLGAAWALSRYGKREVYFSPQGDTGLHRGGESISTLCNPVSPCGANSLQETLSPLPIQALRLPTLLEEALFEVNVQKISDLLDIEPSTLLSRFGPLPIKRLNQALGVEEETFEAVKPLPPPKMEAVFLNPLTKLEQVQKASAILLTKLLKELQEQNKKIASLLLELRCVHAPTILRPILLGTPSSEGKHLLGFLRNTLDSLFRKTFDSETPVEGLALTVTATEDIVSTHTSHLAENDTQSSNSPRQVGELVDSLVSRLGSNHVLQMECRESYRPENAVSYKEARQTLKSPSPAAPILSADRPSYIFDTPQRVRAMALLPDGPPFRLRFDDAELSIRSAHGPERISPEWWNTKDKSQSTRDYFKVQLDSGMWLWIYREIETSLWFLHGLWC